MLQVYNYNPVDRWLVDDELDDVINKIELPKKKRYCYKNLWSYIQKNSSAYISCLYGLRRTGKSVLMQQAIQQLNDEGKLAEVAYITFSVSTSYTDIELIEKIEELY